MHHETETTPVRMVIENITFMFMTVWAFTLIGYFVNYAQTSGNMFVIAVTIIGSGILAFIHYILSKRFPEKHHIFPAIPLFFSVASVITATNLLFPQYFNYELPVWNSAIEKDIAPQFFIGTIWILIPVLLLKLGTMNDYMRRTTFNGFLLVIIWITVFNLLSKNGQAPQYLTQTYDYLENNNVTLPVFRYLFGAPLIYWLNTLLKLSEIRKLVMKP